MSLIWNREALLEFSEAVTYYARIDPDLGGRFVRSIEEATARMSGHPDLFRCFEGDLRKVPVETFPYAVIYRMEGSELHIIAIMHQHRRPGYWRGRVE